MKHILFEYNRSYFYLKSYDNDFKDFKDCLLIDTRYPWGKHSASYVESVINALIRRHPIKPKIIGVVNHRRFKILKFDYTESIAKTLTQNLVLITQGEVIDIEMNSFDEKIKKKYYPHLI